MAHRGANVGNIISNYSLRSLGFLLVPLTVAAVLTACGAAEDSTEPVAEGTQPTLREITTYAGTGSPRFAGDGGLAIDAGFYAPTAVAMDTDGNLHIATDNRVRRVAADTGIITTVAGTGRNHSNGDGGLASEAALSEPKGLTIDVAGNLFIVETSGGLIRRVDGTTGIITTVAGGGIGNPREKLFGDGGPATEALIKQPAGVAVDAKGNLYIATDNRVRKLDASSGIITTYAGIGERGLEGDGGLATEAGLAEPFGVAVDRQGNLYIADSDNHRVRKVDAASGIITTVAGIGKNAERTSNAYRAVRSHIATEWVTTNEAAGGAGYSGDGGPASEARLHIPNSVALDAQGNLYISDGRQRVRRVDSATSVITTVATSETVKGQGTTGKLQVLTTDVGEITSIAVTDSGEVFLADKKKNVVHKVSATASP